ncbi:MAG: outer membrane protein assembly factor BamA [Opitutaceae bacterium]|nr:outer membrane protein assembly factor BamA [Opitutaceae bacterium]
MKTTPSSPLFRAFLVIGLFLAALASGSGQIASEQSQLEALAPKIGTITVKFIGVANVSEQIVRANMQIKEGGILDEAALDRDIRSLYRTGLFEFIQVNREAFPGNKVNLVVEVTPKFRVLNIRFEGNKKVKESRLRKEIKIAPNAALDERQVKDDAEKIFAYYQKSAYNQANVTYTIERNRSTGFGTVTFKIREGYKVRLSGINFIGNDHVKTKALRKEMETRRWHFFSWLTGSGKLQDEKFQEDLDKLRDYYREHGYLDIEIASDKISFDYPKPNRLIITIRVNEGRQYRVGDISFSGNKLYPSSLLQLVVRQKKGAIFAPSLLDKDRERVEDFYGRDGYLETQVRLARKPNLQTSNIDLEYDIAESEKFYVESIKIEGNTKTKSTVIIRELNLGPGDVFDTVRMKTAKAILENTRFFEGDVNMTPETTNIPGRRNLKIAVKEGRTGNLTFGAGFSSLERAVIFTELTQGNFDLFNRRSFFQGDGQKFRLKLSLGSYSSEAILAFEEPWFLERQLALGFQIFRVSSDYSSSYYEEIRLGGEVYLRKNLFELVEGRLGYTYEVVDIRNVESTSSAVIQSLEGKTRVSKVSLMFLRDTRDKIISTTRGNYASLGLGLAGGPFGGGVDYYSIDFHGSQFFPIFEAQEQVLSFLARSGVIQNYGRSKEAPFFDRYFLGGPDSLRGFEYHMVSPKDTLGEPIGGKTYGFFSAEYSIDIVKPMRFALFYDAGFVNKGAYDFNPRAFNDNIGFGLRLFVAGAPLALDFGIPLTTDHHNKQGSQFNFNFGTRF